MLILLARQTTVIARITPTLAQIDTGKIHEGLLFQKPDPAENIRNRLTGVWISELYNSTGTVDGLGVRRIELKYKTINFIKLLRVYSNFLIIIWYHFIYS